MENGVVKATQTIKTRGNRIKSIFLNQVQFQRREDAFFLGQRKKILQNAKISVEGCLSFDVNCL